VLPSEYLEKGAKLAQEFSASLVAVIAGGDTRFQSVKNGLQSLEDNSLVFVHDAVRCLVTPGLIKRCAEGAIEKGNAVPAISATDTIRIENKSGNEQLDRNKVKIIQTPQVFPAGILKKAFEQPYKYSFTDEASVAEALGVEINLVEGESANIKITTPADLLLAEKILEQPRI
jgi:2-C-methyl-D-erythritol 4-phosphate cytidylyltransferase